MFLWLHLLLAPAQAACTYNPSLANPKVELLRCVNAAVQDLEDLADDQDLRLTDAETLLVAQGAALADLQSELAELRAEVEARPSFEAYDGAGTRIGEVQELGRYTHVIDMPGLDRPLIAGIKGNGLSSSEPITLLATPALYFSGPNCTGTVAMSAALDTTVVPAILFTPTGEIYAPTGVVYDLATNPMVIQSIHRIGLQDVCEAYSFPLNLWEVAAVPDAPVFAPGLSIGRR